MKEQHKKKGALPRIRRAATSEIQDDTTHLWAVSYSDFLMVLLSFFILFFSVNKPEEKQSIIQRVVQSTTEVTAAVTNGIKNEIESASKNLKITGVADTIEQKLNDVNVTTIRQGEKLVILFPNNIYKKGGSKLNKAALAHLRKVLSSIKVHQGDIQLTFVGHTDSTAIKHLAKNGIKDNRDLSALRAKKALSAASEAGFSQDQLTTRAAAQYERNSRTLSIEISVRGG